MNTTVAPPSVHFKIKLIKWVTIYTSFRYTILWIPNDLTFIYLVEIIKPINFGSIELIYFCTITMIHDQFEIFQKNLTIQFQLQRHLILNLKVISTLLTKCWHSIVLRRSWVSQVTVSNFAQYMHFKNNIYQSQNIFF